MFLTGIRVARVKVIFELPPEFGRMEHPLAYVEWYTPFTRRDPLIGMYQISRSTRNCKANASVISVNRILGPCLLIGKNGRHIDRTWTSENVLDVAPAFFVNAYTTIETFTRSELYSTL